MKRSPNYIHGFTLIDILISVAIVSFLSSVVLFNVSEGKVKAEDSKKKTEASQVATAIELYKNDNNGKTPISVWSANGTISPSISTGQMYEEADPEYVEVMNKLVETGYLSAIPKTTNSESYAYGESDDGSEAVFAVKLKSRSNISSNTNNSCSVTTGFVDENKSGSTPQIPQCNETYVAQDNEGNDVYSITCPPVEGLNVICTSYFLESWIIPGSKGKPAVSVGDPDGGIQVFNCAYQVPPPEPTTTDQPLCSGGNEDDYCTCI